jgi:hypothetical protein
LQLDVPPLEAVTMRENADEVSKASTTNPHVICKQTTLLEISNSLEELTDLQLASKHLTLKYFFAFMEGNGNSVMFELLV